VRSRRVAPAISQKLEEIKPIASLERPSCLRRAGRLPTGLYICRASRCKLFEIERHAIRCNQRREHFRVPLDKMESGTGESFFEGRFYFGKAGSVRYTFSVAFAGVLRQESFNARN